MYPRLLSGDCLLVEKTAEPKDGAIAVLVQDGVKHRKAHAAVRAAQAPQRDARDGPENEQQHAPEQDK